MMIGAVLVPVSNGTLEAIMRITSGEYWHLENSGAVEYRVTSGSLRELKDDIKGYFRDKDLTTMLSYNYEYVIFYT
jgi:hypothetical protein